MMIHQPCSLCAVFVSFDGTSAETFSPFSPRHAFYPLYAKLCMRPAHHPISPFSRLFFFRRTSMRNASRGHWRRLSRTRTGYWRATTNSLARVAAISKCFGVKRCGRLRSGISDGNDGSLEFRFHRDKFIPSRATRRVQFPLIYH